MNTQKKWIPICIASVLVISLLIISCAKDKQVSDCTSSGAQAGPLFTKVDSLITVSCAGSGCHTQGGNGGGYNFDSKCSIVDNWNAINNSCVIIGNMPPSGFNSTQKQIITNWVNAGHAYTN
jgi:hypothetical protein